jgi:hypothetical protein
VKPEIPTLLTAHLHHTERTSLKCCLQANEIHTWAARLVDVINHKGTSDIVRTYHGGASNLFGITRGVEASFTQALSSLTVYRAYQCVVNTFTYHVPASGIFNANSVHYITVGNGRADKGNLVSLLIPLQSIACWSDLLCFCAIVSLHT